MTTQTRTRTRPRRVPTPAVVQRRSNSGVAILTRVLQPEDAVLSPDAARSLSSLKFDKSDTRRMNQLAAKARQGTLSETERFEAEQYNLVSHLLALLQAKARTTLQQYGLDG